MEYLFLSTLRAEELRVTNENLLKCLNFLGNYSLTAGEITMVLGQVSRYVEEPLKGALRNAHMKHRRPETVRWHFCPWRNE